VYVYFFFWFVKTTNNKNEISARHERRRTLTRRVVFYFFTPSRSSFVTRLPLCGAVTAAEQEEPRIWSVPLDDFCHRSDLIFRKPARVRGGRWNRERERAIRCSEFGRSRLARKKNQKQVSDPDGRTRRYYEYSIRTGTFRKSTAGYYPDHPARPTERSAALSSGTKRKRRALASLSKTVVVARPGRIFRRLSRTSRSIFIARPDADKFQRPADPYVIIRNLSPVRLFSFRRN